MMQRDIVHLSPPISS